MTLIERLLAQANKESNELTELLNEAAQALAQPPQRSFTYYRHYDGGVQDWPDENTIPLYTSPPAQLQQEPVTHQEPIGTYESITDIMLQLRNGTISDYQIYEVMKDKPLYTSPPKKEWIGLTDEEIDALLLPECAGDFEMHDFARDIQSKLKEKNT